MNRCSLLAAAILLFSSTLSAQEGANDPTFNPADIGYGFGDGANEIVWSTCVQPDGKILIGGGFTKYNGTNTYRLTRLNGDGTLDHTFNPPVIGGSQVYSILLEPDGKILIAGDFSVGSRQNIARLNANGSLDTGFTGTWPAGTIICMIRQPNDGKIVIGGYFGVTTSNNRRIARLHPDGTLDASFNISGNGANNAVLAIDQLSDGQILIGGSFTAYNGIARGRIARLDADGNLDAAFQPEVNGNVSSITHQGENDIILAGSFTAINGSTANRIAKVSNAGILDVDFAGVGTNTTVHHVTVQPDGKFLLVGAFGTVDGVGRNGVARLNVDGTLDPLFGLGQGSNSQIMHASVQPDGKIVIGGDRYLSLFDGNYFHSVCRLNLDGSYDTSFNPGSGLNNDPRAITIQPDDKIIVCGGFTRMNGVPRYHIARLDSDGDLDLDFDVGSIQGSVLCTAIQPDGKILIGGGFTAVGSSTRNSIARVHPDGALDTSFYSGSLNYLNSDGYIQSIALQTDGKILIGGQFDTLSGTPHRSLARLLPNGTVDPDFDTGLGVIGNVHDIALQPDGKILLCGIFNNVNGIPRNRLARLNTDGSLDTTFDPGIGPLPASPGVQIVRKLALHPDGRITVVGSFTSYGGVPRNRIARINADGSLDMTFEPSPSTGYSPYSFLLDPSGDLIAIGNYTNSNGTVIPSVVRISPDGSWYPFLTSGLGANSWIECLAMQSDNKLIIGGEFTSWNGAGRNRIARLLNDFTTPTPNDYNRSLTLFPNPANGSFTITSMISGPLDITVVNARGQVVWKRGMQCGSGQPCIIDLGDPPPGLYVIIAKGAEKISTAKVMVN